MALSGDAGVGDAGTECSSDTAEVVKKRKDSAVTEGAGLIRAAQLVNDDLRWIWRGQPERDYGIDAQLEVVDGEAVSGKLLAAQVKSGPSYLNDPTPDGWWYRLNQADL